jgi:hypothetical protein
MRVDCFLKIRIEKAALFRSSRNKARRLRPEAARRFTS